MHDIEALFFMSVDMLCVADVQGTFTRVNPAFERTLGYTAEELTGRPYVEFVHPDDRELTNRETAKLAAGESTIQFENRYRCGDGTYKWLQWTTQPDVAQGKLYAVARDITEIRRQSEKLRVAEAELRDRQVHLERLVEERTAELRKTEDNLRQSQKMEAIGRLAGGVAHDFNNLLTVILGYGSLMLQELPDDFPQRSYVQEIVEAGESAASLTRELLAFSRRQVLQPRILNVNDVVREFENLLRRLLGEHIELLTHLGAKLDPIEFDPGQIQQILLNLTINARDAMPDGGKLTIETANVDLDASYVAGHPGAQAGPHVLLAISDTGIGMDAETRARIFEPFFTTKGLGRGTGLGLSTVYGIVSQSGGNIWVYSEPQHGTTFKVYVPRASRVEKTVIEQPAQPARPTPQSVTGTATIQVVEDESQVRSLIVTALKSAGYHVLESRNAIQALAVYRQHGRPIDLLLTDVVLPGETGCQLAEKLTAIQPDLRVLYMSGYTDNAIVHHGVLDPGTKFLEKPLTPATLLKQIEKTLSD